MTHDMPDIDDVVAVLERTPATLRSLLEGLSPTWTDATEGGGTWSPFDVVGHLVHAERTDWMPRIRHILAGDPRPFEPFEREAMFAASRGKTLVELLETFERERAENVASLRGLGLAPADLDRGGLHPALGDVTLGQLLATWVVHDLNHVVQIARTMAKVYTSAVGPWSEYLSVLGDRPRAVSVEPGRIVGIDHVQIAAPAGAEPAARVFYGDLLGLPELPKPPALAVRGGVWFSCGDQQLHVGIEAEFRPARKAHPALVVAGLDRLEAALVAAGHDVRAADDVPGVRRSFVSDPFGNRLELVDRP